MPSIDQLITDLIAEKLSDQEAETEIEPEKDSEDVLPRNELKDLFSIFRKETGLPCALVVWRKGTDKRPEERLWYSSCGRDQSQFCFLFRSLSVDSHSACQECDSSIAVLARKMETPLLHRCHCGITEIAIPVLSAPSESSRCHMVFITGQLQPPGGFGSPTGQDEALTSALRFAPFVRHLCQALPSYDDLGPQERDEASKIAQLELRHYAEKMEVFDLPVVSRIAHFLKYHLLPFAEANEATLGTTSPHVIRFSEFADLVSFRLRFSQVDQLLEFETSVKYLNGSNRIQPNTMCYSLGEYSSFGGTPVLSVSASRTRDYALPRNVLLLRERMPNWAKELYKDYISTGNGTTLAGKLVIPWLDKARPMASASTYLESTPGAVSRAGSLGARFTIAELKRTTGRFANPQETKEIREIADITANGLHTYAGDLLAQAALAEDKAREWMIKFSPDNVPNTEALKLALSEMLRIPLPSNQEVRFTALLQRMLQHRGNPLVQSELLADYRRERKLDTEPCAF